MRSTTPNLDPCEAVTVVRQEPPGGRPLVHIPIPLLTPCEPKGLREFVDYDTGEILVVRQGHNCAFRVVTTAAEGRALRFRRLAAARQVLGTGHRLGVCHRVPRKGASAVEVWKGQGAAHYQGVMVCARVWLCPVCGAKITERRRVELEAASAIWKAQGGQVWLLTYTFSHGRFDVLAESLERLAAARKLMRGGVGFQAIRTDYGWIGSVTAAEITHGPAHGWHPHLHELAFVSGSADMATFKARMFDRWRRACLRAGLGEPSERHGFDARGGGAAAGYISKGLDVESWGLERELTKGHIKAGRGSNLSPFQILDCTQDPEATPEHREQSRALFHDYERATKGRKQLVWSPGLRDRFAVPEVSDDEIAAQVGDDAVLLASISLDDWAVIVRHHLQAQILTLAENGGAAAVYSVIESYRGVKS